MALASIDYPLIALTVASVLGAAMSIVVVGVSTVVPKWVLFESGMGQLSLRPAWSAMSSSSFYLLTPACVFGSIMSMVVFGLTPKGVASVFLMGALLSLADIDRKHSLLPDVLTLPLLWAGLLVNVDATFVPLREAVIGAASGFASLWLFYWGGRAVLSVEPIGYGDLKFFSAIGAWLGVKALPVVMLVAGAVCAVQIVRTQLGRAGGYSVSNRGPFGPGMAIGATIALFLKSLIATA